MPEKNGINASSAIMDKTQVLKPADPSVFDETCRIDSNSAVNENPNEREIQPKKKRDETGGLAGTRSLSVSGQNVPDHDRLKKIGRYEIVRRLGNGTAGTVFLGQDPYIKRNVAVKLSRPSDDVFRESFFVEAQAAGGLSHTNIVSIYDFDVFDEYCYIAMEYVEGETLDQYAQRSDPPSLTAIVEIIFAISLALDYAHNRGVIHLDIKPSNILIDKNGIPKLADFGIARKGVQKEGGIIIGTPFYIAPERLKRGYAGPKSDLFSLGCVLYELLAGVKPFFGTTLAEVKDKILTGTPAPLTNFRRDVPQELNDIVMTSLAKDPDDRYPSCAEFAYQLRFALRNMTSQVDEARDFFDYVRNVPFFNGFTKEQIQELLKTSNIFRVNQGKILIMEGEVDDAFYIILSGHVAVIKGGRKIAVISSGDCFGEMAFITREPRTATVIAESGCTLIKISSTLLNRASDSMQLLFYQRFSQTLVRRLSSS